jgi:hypothetical protein
MDFRFPVAFLMLLHQRVRLGQHLEAIFYVAQVVSDFRQPGTEAWDEQCCPSGSPGSDPLADLSHPLLAPVLHN